MPGDSAPSGQLPYYRKHETSDALNKRHPYLPAHAATLGGSELTAAYGDSAFFERILGQLASADDELTVKALLTMDESLADQEKKATLIRLFPDSLFADSLFAGAESVFVCGENPGGLEDQDSFQFQRYVAATQLCTSLSKLRAGRDLLKRAGVCGKYLKLILQADGNACQPAAAGCCAALTQSRDGVALCVADGLSAALVAYTHATLGVAISRAQEHDVVSFNELSEAIDAIGQLAQVSPADIEARPEIVPRLADFAWKIHLAEQAQGYVPGINSKEIHVLASLLKAMEQLASVRKLDPTSVRSRKTEPYALCLCVIDVCSDLAYKHKLPSIRESAVSVLCAVSMEAEGKRRIQPSVVASVLTRGANQAHTNRVSGEKCLGKLALKLARSCSEHTPFRHNLIVGLVHIAESRESGEEQQKTLLMLDEIFGAGVGLRYLWEVRERLELNPLLVLLDYFHRRPAVYEAGSESAQSNDVVLGALHLGLSKDARSHSQLMFESCPGLVEKLYRIARSEGNSSDDAKAVGEIPHEQSTPEMVDKNSVLAKEILDKMCAECADAEEERKAVVARSPVA